MADCDATPSPRVRTRIPPGTLAANQGLQTIGKSCGQGAEQIALASAKTVPSFFDDHACVGINTVVDRGDRMYPIIHHERANLEQDAS